MGEATSRDRRRLPREEHTVVDTTRPLEATLAEVRARVQAWPPGLVD